MSLRNPLPGSARAPVPDPVIDLANDLVPDLVVDPRPLSVGRDFEVYSGTHRGQPVAIKVARCDSDTLALEAQLEAEAAVLARLTGSGVVPTLVGLTRLPGGRLALVRGWVEGLSLATLIERALVRRRWQGARRWNAPTRAIVARLCDAVERLHDAGLVHNDLKPDDILIRMRPGGGFDVVLIDLGLAARPKRGGPGGTVAYAAPERLEGDAGTTRSDLWALGAIVFELLAGTRAYAADQPVDARLERRLPIHKSPREAAAHAWRQLPPEVQGALAAALAADPRQRPKQVGAFRRALGLDGRVAARPDDARTDLASRTRALSSDRGARGLRRWFDPVLVAATVATLSAFLLAWGPVSRALGFDRASGSPAACEAVQRRADKLCRGLTGEAACRAALSATDDCVARAELLGACEAP